MAKTRTISPITIRAKNGNVIYRSHITPKKLANGGNINFNDINPNAFNAAGDLLGGATNVLTTNSEGIQKPGGSIAAAALKGAGKGAAAGAAFGPWGAAIGGAVGGIGGAIGGKIKANRAEEAAELIRQQELEAAELAKQARFNSDEIALGNFATQGQETRLFKQGGKLKKRTYIHGGSLNPISNDEVVAQGNTHQQGGIDISPGIEIEDEEVISGDRVYSNNLKFTNDKGKLVTYADEAETLGKLKGEFQSKLDNKTSDRRSKDSANRMISSLNGKLDVLFNTQEASKPITNQQQVDTTTQLADGGNLKPKGLATIPTNDFQVGNLNPINAPASNTDLTFGQQFKQGVNTFDYAGLANNSAMFLDNIYNARLIRQTPKVAKPELLTPAKLKTNVNVNAELNVIDESIRDFSTGVARTTSNSNVANARRLAAVGQGIKARGPIFSAKRRAETALKNQSAINAQRVEAGNLGLINQFNKDVVDRQRGILEAKSANVADASGNIQTIFENKQKAAFQDKQLKLNQVINGDSEAWVRTLDSGSYDGYYRNDPSAAKNDYDRLKLNGRVQDAEKLKLHVGQLGINVINW